MDLYMTMHQKLHTTLSSVKILYHIGAKEALLGWVSRSLLWGTYRKHVCICMTEDSLCLEKTHSPYPSYHLLLGGCMQLPLLLFTQRTAGFDLYMVLDPLIAKSQAILLGNKLIRWITVRFMMAVQCINLIRYLFSFPERRGEANPH